MVPWPSYWRNLSLHQVYFASPLNKNYGPAKRNVPLGVVEECKGGQHCLCRFQQYLNVAKIRVASNL